MSDEEKARLRETLRLYTPCYNETQDEYNQRIDAAVVEIDQTLREKGYGKLSPLARFKRDKAMSPNYFLKRFREELDAEKQFIPAGMYKLILKVAERAAKVQG